MIPKDYKPSKTVVIICSIVLGSFLIYGTYTRFKVYRAFSGEVRYTIGVTTKRYIQANGREIDYIYHVNGVAYDSHAGYAYNSQVPGGKYWVKYSVKYPEVSEIYQNFPVDPPLPQV